MKKYFTISLKTTRVKQVMKTRSIVFLFIMCFWQGQAVAQSTSDCRNSNYQVLIDLYYATEGWNWTNPWDFGQPMENWYGVEMTEGCVTQLSLSNNNLRGYIPESITQLSEIRVLDLSANQLGNTIPADIGNLQQLQVLYLYQNQLVGAIPPSIGEIPFLISLNIQFNQLSDTIPAALGNLKQLHTLSLENNSLVGQIPDTIGTLQNLVFLDLSHNQLTGSVPEALGNLSELTFLELDNNALSGCLPTDIDQLKSLETLNLSYNQFFCPFPQELFSLTNLKLLYLEYNYFYGWLPERFDSLQDVSIIHLNNNLLSGPLPNSLSDLAQLQEIHFQTNYFAGCFPNAYSNFCAIDTDFSNNSNLPDAGDFTAFCTNGTGACEVIIADILEMEEDEGPCLQFDFLNTLEGCSPDNTISVDISRGEATFTIMLQGPVSGTAATNNQQFSITGLPSGDYSLKITDQNGCEMTKEVTLSSSCLSDRISSSRNKLPELTLNRIDDFSLLQVGDSYPNPFQTNTHIPVVLTEKGAINLQVFTATGQQIHQQEQVYEAGAHLITLHQQLFSEAGMYIYKIKVGEQIEQGKLIRQ